MGDKAIGEYLGSRIRRAWRLTRHGGEGGILDSSLQEPQGTMKSFVDWELVLLASTKSLVPGDRQAVSRDCGFRP